MSSSETRRPDDRVSGTGEGEPGPSAAPDAADTCPDVAGPWQRLIAGVEELLGDGYRAGPGKPPPDRAGWLILDEQAVLGPCPARWVNRPPEDDFVPSVPLVSRALGRLVLSRWDGTVPVPDLVVSVVSDLAHLPAWIADWLVDLDRAATAAVRAAVTTWAFDALASVRGRVDLQWVGATQKVDIPGRAVQLRARWDAVMPNPRRPEVLLVHSGRRPDPQEDQVTAGFVALVVCRHARHAPRRVRLSCAGAGRSRAVPVTAELLDCTVDRLLAAVAHAMEPDGAATVAGRWCGHCHLLDRCSDGLATQSREPEVL